MGPRFRILLAALLLLTAGPFLRGQDAPPDSVFRLVQADRAEQYEQYGMHYRLVQGHARFLHNDTYLLCDSASWNVDSRFIEAYGNVQLIQDKTMLRSEEMTYWIDESRAVFRGRLVELFDKDGNTLRTDRLTYNTKDSVAVFEGGGAMKDKDGNVIESARGTYDGKEGLFTFEDRVEIYMDSIEIRTHILRYFSEEEKAYFGRNTQAWKDNGFLRADAGWYDRSRQQIQFSDRVLMFDPVYEAWADEVYYQQSDGSVDLYHNAQVLDTVHQNIYLGDHLQYIPANDSLSQRGLLTGDPAIVYYGENEDHQIDTLYSRADTFFVYTVPRCDIPEAEVKEADTRVQNVLFDALSKKRETEAKQREEERIKKLREVGKLPPEWVEKQQQAEADSLAKLSRLDSLAAAGVLDSLVVADQALRASLKSVDSLINVGLTPPPADTLTAQPGVTSDVMPGVTSDVMPGLTGHLPDSLSAQPEYPGPPVEPGVTQIVVPADTLTVQPGLTSDVMPGLTSDVMPGLTGHLPDSTTSAPPDTVSLASRDTTPIRYILAWHNVKVYRSDLQAVCDSLAFCDLDSIARLFGSPALWNEVRNQLTADEMQLLMRNGSVERGSMLTNAWIISQQDTSHYNQIKSTEMLGYFRDNKLYRFDALGGVSAIFYMTDEDVITTINVKEAKSMTAAIKDATAQRMIYMESIKSDVYPVGELPAEKQRLKDFKWRGDERPVSRSDITGRTIRASERAQYEGVKKPLYRETNKYFDNYMLDLFEKLDAAKKAELERRQRERDSLAREALREAMADSLAVTPTDTVFALPVDTLTVQPVDTLNVMPGLTPTVMPGVTGHLPDTVTVQPGQPGPPVEPRVTQIVTPADTITVASPETVVKSDKLTRAEKRALRRAERKARREARRAERLARRRARKLQSL